MRSLLAAFSFLTAIPVPSSGLKEDDFAKSLIWFPLVGAVIGAICAGAAYGLCQLPLAPLTRSVLLVSLWGALSGGLHLDGLADSADGLLSHRPRETMLEIMRDSRIGTMGVLALLATLALKVTLLTEFDPRWLAYALLLAPITARTGMVINLRLCNYARREGLGKAFFDSARGDIILVGLVWILLVCHRTIGLPLAPYALIPLAVSTLWSLYTQRRLQGATGDTVGAGCEITEVTTLLTLCLLPVG